MIFIIATLQYYTHVNTLGEEEQKNSLKIFMIHDYLSYFILRWGPGGGQSTQQYIENTLCTVQAYRSRHNAL